MSYNVYFEDEQSRGFNRSFKDVAEGRYEQILLIKKPTKLTHVEIRDLNEQKIKGSYTVTLYTEKWQISIDDTIDISNDRSIDDRDIMIGRSVYLNLHNIESFKVTIKKKERTMF